MKMCTLMIVLFGLSANAQVSGPGGGGNWFRSYFMGLVDIVLFTAEDSKRMETEVGLGVMSAIRALSKTTKINPTTRRLCRDTESEDCPDTDVLAAKNDPVHNIVFVNLHEFFKLDLRSQMRTATHELASIAGYEKNSDSFSRIMSEYARLDLHSIATYESAGIKPMEYINGKDYQVWDNSGNGSSLVTFCERRGYAGYSGTLLVSNTRSSEVVQYDSRQTPHIVKPGYFDPIVVGQTCKWYSISRNP